MRLRSLNSSYTRAIAYHDANKKGNWRKSCELQKVQVVGVVEVGQVLALFPIMACRSCTVGIALRGYPLMDFFSDLYGLNNHTLLYIMFRPV